MSDQPYVAGISYLIMEMLSELTLHDEGEWGGTKTEFLAFNDAGLEMEVGEFFYSMVRMLKPLNVLETGTHFGIGAMYMGLALKHNKKGKLTTIEHNKAFYEKAIDRLKRLGVTEQVDARNMDINNYTPKPDQKFGLILLDTEPDMRFGEFMRYHESLEEGGFLFIHDLHRHMHQIPNEEHGFAWPYGKIPQQIIDLVNDGVYRPIHFSTPRGLTGFYKVHLRDHKWQ